MIYTFFGRPQTKEVKSAIWSPNDAIQIFKHRHCNFKPEFLSRTTYRLGVCQMTDSLGVSSIILGSKRLSKSNSLDMTRSGMIITQVAPRITCWILNITIKPDLCNESKYVEAQSTARRPAERMQRPRTTSTDRLYERKWSLLYYKENIWYIIFISWVQSFNIFLGISEYQKIRERRHFKKKSVPQNLI